MSITGCSVQVAVYSARSGARPVERYVSVRVPSPAYPLPAPRYPVFRSPVVDAAGFQLAWQWDDPRKGPSVNVAVTEVGVVVPYWALALPAGVVAAWWLAQIRRQRNRAQAGAVPCSECGYDLRATPGRCPECGAECAGY